MWSAARSAKISMILCMPERVSGGDAKFQGFCHRWNKWEGQEEEEEGVTLKMAEAADETTFWFSGNSGKALVADMLRRGLEFNHLGLRKVVCRSKVKAQPVFEVLFDATDIGDAA